MCVCVCVHVCVCVCVCYVCVSVCDAAVISLFSVYRCTTRVSTMTPSAPPLGSIMGCLLLGMAHTMGSHTGLSRTGEAVVNMDCVLSNHSPVDQHTLFLNSAFSSSFLFFPHCQYLSQLGYRMGNGGVLHACSQQGQCMWYSHTGLLPNWCQLSIHYQCDYGD